MNRRKSAMLRAAAFLFFPVLLWGLCFPAAAEKEEERFLLTFVGDCTLGSDAPIYGNPISYTGVVGSDFAYPMANVLTWFENDEFTMANLEGPLLDSGRSDKKGYVFHGPTEYVGILTQNSIEAVTVANNHTMDYGIGGYESTLSTLTEAGVTYAEDCSSLTVFTTEHGLKLGLYAASLTMGVQHYRSVMDLTRMEEEIAEMREQGVDLVILALHWGTEASYTPIPEQITLAHRLIDLGVDIIYGTHPHFLQKTESYHGGVIYYSLGNFSFGGHTWPRDIDTVIMQQEVIRDADGTVRLGQMLPIPAAITSSGTHANNYQPTPYPEGSEDYERVLAKLAGTYR